MKETFVFKSVNICYSTIQLFLVYLFIRIFITKTKLVFLMGSLNMDIMVVIMFISFILLGGRLDFCFADDIREGVNKNINYLGGIFHGGGGGGSH